MSSPPPSATRAAVIERWLQYDDDGNFSERPSLRWYARAIVVHLSERALPERARRRMLRAANYYGDYSLVHDLAAPILPLEFSAYHFDALKQAGKAFKNSGEFEKARSCYRRAIELASRNHQEDYIAYFLLLYAKLCDRYQQRSAWYRAFHRIAHERLHHLASAGGEPRLTRWCQIADDALGKAIYSASATDGEEASKLFERALQNASAESDAYVRVVLALNAKRFFFAACVLGAPQDPALLRSDLDALLGLTRVARRLGNERAWAVRRVQYLQIARQIRTTYRQTPSER